MKLLNEAFNIPKSHKCNESIIVVLIKMSEDIDECLKYTMLKISNHIR